MPSASPQPAPIRSVQGFEQEYAREAADLQWARNAASAIAAWLPNASVAAHSSSAVQLDVPKEVVQLDDVDRSGRARALIALLAAAGWSAAAVMNGRVSLYAARHAIEIVTDEGERFSPMYNPPRYSNCEITIDISKGARRGCADGAVEWIPRRRFRVVRYLNRLDASDAALPANTQPAGS